VSLRDRLAQWRAQLEPAGDAKGRRRWLSLSVRLVIAALVIAGVGSQFMKLTERVDWSRIEFSPWELVLSFVLYLCGMTLVAAFFSRVVKDMGGQALRRFGVVAWWVSQLGKYIPGKAWVVVVRCGLLSTKGVPPAVTTVASFYETPMMVAVGAAVACALFAADTKHDLAAKPLLLLMSGAIAVGLGLVLTPWAFAKVAKVLSLPFGRGGDAPPPVRARTVLRGVPTLVAAWLLNGASFVACVSALSSAPVPVSDWPLLIAASGLAVAAGFVVVVMPGGLGVREWVIMSTLSPVLGPELAVLSAVALRLVWLAVELVASAGSYLSVEASYRRLSRQP